MITPYNDEYFMKQALNEAKIAYENNEVPVGAIIVANKKIIAKCHNRTEQLNDVTAHAEIQAITAASEYLGAKYLKGCTMYVTLEPCPMCVGALYWSQIDKVIFAARDTRRKKKSTSDLYHPKTLVTNGLMAKESSLLLKKFFSEKRD